MRRSRDFVETTRRGARAAGPLLVVHLDPGADGSASRSRPGSDPRAGFVVSRAVGGSVVRHSVARRLRHQLAPRLRSLPAGTRVVVRALPAAATATSAELGAELDRALERALDRASSRAVRASTAGVTP
jgi:ribonuclease P protein component